MQRPTTKQWIVLWTGALWSIGSLVIVEEYVVRALVGGLVVTGLLYWQLMPTVTSNQPSRNPPEPGEQIGSPELGWEAVSGPTIIPSPRMVGVSGWLAFFVLSLLVFWPLRAIASLAKIAASANGGAAFAGSLAIVAPMAGWAVYCAIALIQAWHGAPKRALRFISIATVLVILDAIVTISEGKNAAYTLGQMFGGLIWSVVWALYLLKSKRVRNTFDPSCTVEPKRWTAVLTACGVAAVVALVGSSEFAQAQKRLETSADTLGAYELVKYSRRLGASEFDKGFLGSQRVRLQSALPQTTFSLRDVRFTDIGTAIRGITTFVGEMKFRDGTTELAGTSLSFFHRTGVLAIDGFCFPKVGTCEQLSDLLAAAERSAITRFEDDGLDGILPEGSCQTETTQAIVIPSAPTRTVTCSYASDGVILSIARVDVETFRNVIRASGNWEPEVKRTIARLAKADAAR